MSSWPAGDELAAMLDEIGSTKRPSAGKIKALTDLVIKYHKVCEIEGTMK
jgi:hypothetical protein